MRAYPAGWQRQPPGQYLGRIWRGGWLVRAHLATCLPTRALSWSAVRMIFPRPSTCTTSANLSACSRYWVVSSTVVPPAAGLPVSPPTAGGDWPGRARCWAHRGPAGPGGSVGPPAGDAAFLAAAAQLEQAAPQAHSRKQSHQPYLARPMRDRLAGRRNSLAIFRVRRVPGRARCSPRADSLEGRCSGPVSGVGPG
jgi:hypothetical protein